jgi:hypothetical protein
VCCVASSEKVKAIRCSQDSNADIRARDQKKTGMPGHARYTTHADQLSGNKVGWWKTDAIAN